MSSDSNAPLLHLRTCATRTQDPRPKTKTLHVRCIHVRCVHPSSISVCSSDPCQDRGCFVIFAQNVMGRWARGRGHRKVRICPLFAFTSESSVVCRLGPGSSTGRIVLGHGAQKQCKLMFYRLHRTVTYTTPLLIPCGVGQLVSVRVPCRTLYHLFYAHCAHRMATWCNGLCRCHVVIKHANASGCYPPYNIHSHLIRSFNALRLQWRTILSMCTGHRYARLWPVLRPLVVSLSQSIARINNLPDCSNNFRDMPCRWRGSGNEEAPQQH